MIDFIINPIAGGKKGKKMKKNLNLVENYLKEKQVEYSFHFTTYKGHAKKITEELIENGAMDIVVCGGDGTLHEVVNGFSRFENVNLGLLPCGTGNDFARALNLPTNVIEALEIILKGETKYIDFMQMPTVRGINIIGTGIDIDVLKRYESLKKKTKLGYTKCLIKSLFKFKNVEFDVTINGETEHRKSILACIANGCVYGGGIPICPVASPNDNLLNFITADDLKGLKLISVFLKLKKGKVLSVKEVVHKKSDKISFKINPPYTINVDGELYDDIPFEIEIVSNKLKMYC